MNHSAKFRNAMPAILSATLSILTAPAAHAAEDSFLAVPAADGSGNPYGTGVRVSGHIIAAEHSAVDSDVNDATAPYSSNDAPASAQPLQAPVAVGGFASAAGTGRAGDRFAGKGDFLDAFRIRLEAGWRITLTVADHQPLAPPANDLDLFLYDSNDPSWPVASSEGIGPHERIVVPADGHYHVVVGAYNGVSNYVLQIGGGTAHTARGLDVSTEFVPGEVVLTLEEDAGKLTNHAALKTRLAGLGLKLRAGRRDAPILVELASDAADKLLAGASQNATKRRASPYGGMGLADDDGKRRDKRETILAVKALRARDDVATADLNYIRRPYRVPNDEFYAYQWHYPSINLPEAWKQTTGSADVVIAVLDTGVMLEHPDLAANLSNDGFDFISDPATARDGDGIDPDPDDPGDRSNPDGSSSFHGTHVAGTIAAVSDNGIGVAGVAWHARILPVRVLGHGGGTSYDIIQGVRYAAGLSSDAGRRPEKPADVINLSLGGVGYSATEQAVYRSVRERGTIVVAAAGNEDTSRPAYPASYEGVISVSAVDARLRRAPYSNYGDFIDVAAPGGNFRTDADGDGFGDSVLSTMVGLQNGRRVHDYGFKDGTSMAAPHVAGVIALMKSVHPELSPATLDRVLADGRITRDLKGDGPNVRNADFGYGLIDALSAVQTAAELTGGAPAPSRLQMTPANLDFGTNARRRSFKLSAQDAGVRVTEVRADAAWIRVSPEAVGRNGLGRYRVSVDRRGLSNGSHGARIQIRTADGTLAGVTVSLRVGNAVKADAGRHYVLLIEAFSGDVTAVDVVDARDGIYVYAFHGVPRGRYYVMAGSDLDNDLLICDPGEACGAYPTLGRPVPIRARSGHVRINPFTTGFTGGFQPADARGGEAPRGQPRL